MAKKKKIRSTTASFNNSLNNNTSIGTTEPGNLTIHTDSTDIIIYGEKEGVCDSCKEIKQLSLGFKFSAIERKICGRCLNMKIDKMFKTGMDVDFEEVLYDD